MMPRLLTFLMLPVALASFASFAFGQAPSPSTRPAITLRLLAEVVPEDLGPVCLVAGENRSDSIEISANNVSEPVVVGARKLALKLSDKDLSLCSFTLPDAGKSFVVIFSPAKPAGYRAEVVRTDDPTFKRGDVFFLNRTDQTILGKLGTKPLVLAPGKSVISRPAGATDGAYYDIAFAARTDAGDKILSTVRWPIDDQIRSYIFFVQDPNGRVSYRAVDEFVPAEKAR